MLHWAALVVSMVRQEIHIEFNGETRRKKFTLKSDKEMKG